MKIPARGFTHAGKFHADDVFATALLQILRPDIKVSRGFVVPDDFDGIVYDIGDGMFDHHREPRETRPNGVPYAAFGLLWRMLGPGLVGERQARLIDENFIQPLDLNDNTGEQNSLCDAIGFFNPTWDSPDSADDRFFEAVAVAKTDFDPADRVGQRRQPGRRKGPGRLCSLQGRHRGAALLSALEKRPVQDRRPVCGLSQPAGGLERPVRHRPPDQKAQTALSRLLGRPDPGCHPGPQRVGWDQFLPRQPVSDYRQGQTDRGGRLPPGAEKQWTALR